jgi:phosphatidylglycerophosphatase A
MSPPGIEPQARVFEGPRHWLATGFGAGLAPIAPGTFGSLPGLLLAWGLVELGGQMALAAGIVVVAVVGTWAAHGLSARLGLKDPGVIVVDEIAGQMLTLLGIALSGPVLAAGFVLFRAMDVLKPPPARQLEALPGGYGIMADDLAAGVYANLALRAALAWLPQVVSAA